MSKKKKLLNESEVRDFMKYANLNPLTENFMARLREEEEEEEDVGGEEEMTSEVPPAPGPEPEAPEEMAPEGDEDMMSADASPEEIVRSIISAISDAVEDVAGVEIEIEGEEEEEEEEEGGEMEEPSMEEPSMEEPSAEPPKEEEEEEESLMESKDRKTIKLTNKMIKEVSLRVAKKLAQMKKGGKK